MTTLVFWSLMTIVLVLGTFYVHRLDETPAVRSLERALLAVGAFVCSVLYNWPGILAYVVLMVLSELVVTRFVSGNGQ
ncbi:hypothetical protein LJ739_08715 [Aestuariibacter halophilus]|uniref:Uncharacterized protein n=1 Tax=Fluctibacter halophilus TaxID=226011 RepID=A0ABS8G930_9ALTE|nr:hypothetical protein [Aestuariibacter halophilus]MCC2616320.1 hypothetical protein [Aestuariibacter halophilus]